jgi:hypothetical protein
MNYSLNVKVIWDEMHSNISSMQKGKIPRPDGITVEFYLCFYDIFKEDILKVVLESQYSRKILRSFNATYFSLIPKK